jgi:hypothetical protein
VNVGELAGGLGKALSAGKCRTLPGASWRGLEQDRGEQGETGLQRSTSGHIGVTSGILARLLGGNSGNSFTKGETGDGFGEGQGS